MRLRVEAVLVGGVDVRVARVVFSAGVVGDVLELILVVSCVCDAVCVVSILPDFAVELVAHGERETALDELDAAFDGLVWSGCNEYVDVIGHDDEAVEREAGLIAVTEEDVHHEIRVGGALEDSVTLVCDGGDSEGLGLDSDAWAGIRRHISRG